MIDALLILVSWMGQRGELLSNLLNKDSQYYYIGRMWLCCTLRAESVRLKIINVMSMLAWKTCQLSFAHSKASRLQNIWSTTIYGFCAMKILANHIPALSEGNLGHVDLSTSCWYMQPSFLTFTHAASSLQLLWCTISKFQYLNYASQVWSESYAAGHIDESSTIVIIRTGSHSRLTAPSMTQMTSLTYILLVQFVSNWICGFSLNSNRQHDIKFIHCLSPWFGHKNFCMACTTLAHAQTYHHIS